MGWREVFFYMVAGVMFFIIMPLVCYMIAIYFPYPILDNYKNYLCGFGIVMILVGVTFSILANVSLIKVGKGGAGVFGKIKLMKETEHLVTKGVYSFCRNPMHLGLILFYCGLALIFNSLSAMSVAFLTLIFAYISALYCDEPRLKHDFKEEYVAYCKKVGRFLPYITKRTS